MPTTVMPITARMPIQIVRIFRIIFRIWPIPLLPSSHSIIDVLTPPQLLFSVDPVAVAVIELRLRILIVK